LRFEVMMHSPPYWNHNTAYYRWIDRRVSDAGRILDVGCGDGSLASCLDGGGRTIVGIDEDECCIARARAAVDSPNVSFLCAKFEEYRPEEPFDAVIFTASLHHMNMREALKKAKGILFPGGRLLIVGLAKPSSIPDHLLELLRVVPSGLLSALRSIRTAEEAGVPTQYEFPPMSEVRQAVRDLLPGASIRYGLHYRYLLEWRNMGRYPQ
jgi:2-polyprenyl-3-methyl-5-hydroxy-6-metoxy-1,4-benzoquinol methylase